MLIRVCVSSLIENTWRRQLSFLEEPLINEEEVVHATVSDGHSSVTSEDDFHDLPSEFDDDDLFFDDKADHNGDVEFLRSAAKNLMSSLTEMEAASGSANLTDALHSVLYADDYMVTIKNRRFLLAFLDYTQFRVEKQRNPDRFRFLASLKRMATEKKLPITDETPSPVSPVEIKSTKKKRQRRAKKRKNTNTTEPGKLIADRTENLTLPSALSPLDDSPEKWMCSAHVHHRMAAAPSWYRSWRYAFILFNQNNFVFKFFSMFDASRRIHWQLGWMKTSILHRFLRGLTLLINSTITGECDSSDLRGYSSNVICTSFSDRRKLRVSVGCRWFWCCTFNESWPSVLSQASSDRPWHLLRLCLGEKYTCISTGRKPTRHSMMFSWFRHVCIAGGSSTNGWYAKSTGKRRAIRGESHGSMPVDR